MENPAKNQIVVGKHWNPHDMPVFILKGTGEIVIHPEEAQGQ